MMGPLHDSRRIVILGSPFLRSLVRKLLPPVPDVEIVAELDTGEEARLAATTGETEADFVIVAVREPALSDIHLDLLEQRPRVKVLAVAGNRNDAFLWELRPEHKVYGEISPEALLEAIRRPDWRSAPVT
jgi:DNA-binding NarL/FixJ family response regulator